MENLRDLQAQARNLERSGQHAAALELYGRIVEEPAGDREGGIWARVGRLQIALGRNTDAADSYGAATERYQVAGLANLALSCCQHSLRADESRPEMLLRFGQLSAAQGYPRDARHGYVEYADRATAGGDSAAAAQALREYLGRFPSDDAVRRRLAELTGEDKPLPPPAAPPAPEPAAAAARDRDRAEHAPLPEPTTEHAPSGSAIAPLEGFEPTSAGDDFAATASEELVRSEREEDGDISGLDGSAEAEALQEHEDEPGSTDPLPLLGTDDLPAGSVSDDDGSVDGAGDEPLPLMELEWGESTAAAQAAPEDPARRIDRARERVAADPDSLSARRELLALLRDRGDASLPGTLADAEGHFADAGRHGEALEFVEELARLDPESTPLQQRRVERALRAGNRHALVEAYLALAGRFEADLDTKRAQDALQRVLELDPANEDARAALASVTAAASPPRDYVDLGELILSDAPEEVTRFQVAIGDPTGDEESDFAEILDLFRKKVSESLDPKDAASHYDLGLAFKEMGLLDDAIVHLQSGLRGGANPLATLEVLGECFVLKGQVSLAARVFERATRLDGVGDSDLVGVLYGLARCQEDLGLLEEARATYERVVAVDLAFRDAAGRLQLLQSR